jgi:histidine ammonia-lyase
MWTARRLREPLSTRYAAHVLGAARESVAGARRTVEIELNALVDNPVLLEGGFFTSSSGHSSGQALAAVLDAMTVAVGSVAVTSERRTARLLDPVHSAGLPAFLVHPAAPPGVSSGLMIAQYTAAALVGELRQRSAATSLQSIPVSAGSEDDASMSALGARHARWAIDTAETVVAIELLAAAQASDIAGRPLPAALRGAHERLRASVPPMLEDRVISDDIQAALAVLRAGAFSGVRPG